MKRVGELPKGDSPFFIIIGKEVREMRDEKKLYQFCIKADNVHEFNDQMKAFCQSHKVIRITPFPDFLAYIDYEETETILESRLELFESIESHKCGDFPLLIKPADGRN